jgi:rfaE bifunctional protein nucleotidyltransferase chain/domain
MGRVVQLKGLIRIRNKAKRERKKVVFTNGCFDLLHRGHAEYLKKAKSLGDILVVGVNSDPSVRKIKGKGRPITSERERSYLLASLASVDFVIIFQEQTPEKLISSIQPDILVKGGDYKKDEILGRKTVLGSGGKVLTIPFVKGYSTKKLIQRIQRRKFNK